MKDLSFISGFAITVIRVEAGLLYWKFWQKSKSSVLFNEIKD